MKIDFDTGKVYYPDEDEELKESLEEMKIKENLGMKTGVEKEALFQKTRHKGLPYGRLKYIFLLFVVNGRWFFWYYINWSNTEYYGSKIFII